MTKQKAKVSFDFDGTLSHKTDVQQYAKELIERGIDVWIVTRRYDVHHAHLWPEATHWHLKQVLRKIGLSSDKLVYTNMEYKHKYLRDTDFLWHLDDEEPEIHKLHEEDTSVEGIWVHNKKWREITELLLDEYGRN